MKKHCACFNLASTVMVQPGFLQLIIALLPFVSVTIWLMTSKRFSMDVYFDRRYSQQMTANISVFFDDIAMNQKDKQDDIITRVNRTEQVVGYAVLSSDHHLEYLFTLPIIVLSWRRLGIETLIILIGTREQYESDETLNFVLEYLKILNVRLFFIHSTMANSFTLAQVSRLFVAALNGLNMTNSTILITADADMISFNLSSHFPDLQVGKKIFLYNSKCCELMRREGENKSYPHIPMNTIAMTVELWREVMKISPDSLTSGDQIADRLYAEFGKELVRGDGEKGSKKWEMDQNLFSSQLHQWIVKGSKRKLLIAEKHHHGLRYDRIQWPYDFAKETLAGKDDAHLLLPTYGSYWFRTVGLLRLIFTAQELQWCNEYHDRFLKLACPYCNERIPVYILRSLFALLLIFVAFRSL